MRKVPEGNKGLGKLPPAVRNKMGFMKAGGGVKKKGMAMGGPMKKKGYAMGGPMKKKGYAMGGMMPERKINPSTGMAMKKGGMIDMRKSGMFSKGGMTKKNPRGK